VKDRSRRSRRNVITIRRLASVAGSNKPPGWNRWSEAEKVAHLLGMSLGRMHDYLAWPADGLDPYRLAAQTQVIRVAAMVAPKAGVEAARAGACPGCDGGRLAGKSP
jgi:hypothetical protein